MTEDFRYSPIKIRKLATFNLDRMEIPEDFQIEPLKQTAFAKFKVEEIQIEEFTSDATYSSHVTFTDFGIMAGLIVLGTAQIILCVIKRNRGLGIRSASKSQSATEAGRETVGAPTAASAVNVEMNVRRPTNAQKNGIGEESESRKIVRDKSTQYRRPDGESEYYISDDWLYLKNTKKPKLVIPKSLQYQLIKDFHRYYDHVGRNKLVRIITESDHKIDRRIVRAVLKDCLECYHDQGI